MSAFFERIAGIFSSADFYVSFPFWAAFAVAALIYRMAPERPALKQCLLLLSSLCMLLLLPRFTPPIIGVFLALCGVTYAVGGLLNNRLDPSQTKLRKSIAAGGILAVVLVL